MSNNRHPSDALGRIPISRFEFAIMRAAKIPDIAKYRPVTPEEESQQREEKIKTFFDGIKMKQP